LKSIKKETHEIKIENSEISSKKIKKESKYEIKMESNTNNKNNKKNNTNSLELKSELMQERKVTRLSPKRIKKEEFGGERKKTVKSISKKNKSLIDDEDRDDEDTEDDDNNDGDFEIDSFEEIKVKSKRMKKEA